MANLEKFNDGNYGAFAHDERNINNPVQYRKNYEIDKRRTHLNYDIISGKTAEQSHHGDLRKKLEARLEQLKIQHRRANTVTFASWVVTLPAELKEAPSEKQREFFQHTVQFLKNRYGADNIIGAWVHNDETTPHVHVKFVPEERVITRDAAGKDITDYNAFQGTGKLLAKQVLNRGELLAFHRALQQHLEREMGMPLSILNDATKKRGRNATITELKAESIHAAELGKQSVQQVQASVDRIADASKKAAELAEQYGEAVKDAKRQAEGGSLLWKSGWQKRLEALENGLESVREQQKTVAGLADELTEAARLVPDEMKRGWALAEAVQGAAAQQRRKEAEEEKRRKDWWQKRLGKVKEREGALDKREDELDKRQAAFTHQVNEAAKAMLKRQGDRLTAAMEATAAAEKERRAAETARDGARSEAMQAERAREAAKARQAIAEQGAADAEKKLAELHALTTPAAKLAESLRESIKQYGARTVENVLGSMWQLAHDAGGVHPGHTSAVGQMLVRHEQRQQQEKAAELARQQAEQARQRQQRQPEQRRSRGFGLGM